MGFEKVVFYIISLTLFFKIYHGKSSIVNDRFAFLREI